MNILHLQLIGLNFYLAQISGNTWLDKILIGVICSVVALLVKSIADKQTQGNKYERMEDITKSINPLDQRLDNLERFADQLKADFESLNTKTNRIGQELRENTREEKELRSNLSEIKGDIKVIMTLIETLKKAVDTFKKYQE
ncbi:MAG: hypothetical protein AB4372_00695 [Xenococcus sp. (in: cyanobacteria)]